MVRGRLKQLQQDLNMSTKKLIIFAVILIFVIKILLYSVAPTLDRFLYNTFHKQITSLSKITSQEECVSKGGTWGKAGIFPKEFCRYIMPDFDQTCFSGFQCQSGKCLDYTGIKNKKIFALGRCSRYTAVFGCISEIHFGVVGQTVCFD